MIICWSSNNNIFDDRRWDDGEKELQQTLWFCLFSDICFITPGNILKIKFFKEICSFTATLSAKYQVTLAVIYMEIFRTHRKHNIR